MLPSNSLNVTIAIATYDRADELRLTLRGLAEVCPCNGIAHEVLVIDNNSTDETPRVVREAQLTFPVALRHVREERQGLSHARNRAIAEASYDIIAFLDDDVDVDRDWLRALVGAYRRDDYASVGGRAFLTYPGSRPAWLGERDEGYLTKVELGLEPREALPDELYGLNISFRREWFDRVGAFRTDLGRIGTCLVGSEETELLDRIARSGGRLLYEAGAVVGHRVPRERLRRRWFWARGFWGHRGQARTLPARQVSAIALLRSAWHVTLASRDAIWAALRHGPGSEQCFHYSEQVATRAGTVAGVIDRMWGRRTGAAL